MTSSQDHRVNIVVVGSPSLHLRRKDPRVYTSQDLHVGTIVVDATSPYHPRRHVVEGSSSHLQVDIYVAGQNHGTCVTSTPNCSCRAHTLYSLATRVSVIHTPSTVVNIRTTAPGATRRHPSIFFYGGSSSSSCAVYQTSALRFHQLVDIRPSSSTLDHLRRCVRRTRHQHRVSISTRRALRSSTTADLLVAVN